MADLRSLGAIVLGRVQGVFFRTFVSRWASELGLSGYVRNLPDGNVEVRAEGEKEQLARLVRHLGEGPPAARVEKVITRWSEFTGKYEGFRVRY